MLITARPVFYPSKYFLVEDTTIPMFELKRCQLCAIQNCFKFPSTSSKTSFVDDKDNYEHVTDSSKQRDKRFLSLPGGNISHPIDTFNSSSFFKECAIQTEVSAFSMLLIDWSLFRTLPVFRQNQIIRNSQLPNEAKQSQNGHQRAHKGHLHRITANAHRRTVTNTLNANEQNVTVIDQWFTRDKLYMKRFIICNYHWILVLR